MTYDDWMKWFYVWPYLSFSFLGSMTLTYPCDGHGLKGNSWWLGKNERMVLEVTWNLKQIWSIFKKWRKKEII